jgi:hypothetical protein
MSYNVEVAPKKYATSTSWMNIHPRLWSFWGFRSSTTVEQGAGEVMGKMGKKKCGVPLLNV